MNRQALDFLPSNASTYVHSAHELSSGPMYFDHTYIRPVRATAFLLVRWHYIRRRE